MPLGWRRPVPLLLGLLPWGPIGLRQGLGSAANTSAGGGALLGFVPGVVGPLPGVQVHRGASSLPLGRGRAHHIRTSPHILPGQRQTLMPLRERPLEVADSWPYLSELYPAQAQRQGPSLADMLRANNTPVFVQLNSADIVKQWTQDVVTAGIGSVQGSDDEARQAVWDTFELLYQIRRDIDGGVPQMLYALTPDKRSEDIQARDILAIATITDEETASEFQGGGFERMNVGQFMVNPGVDQPKRIGAKLLCKIVDWAVTSGEIVSVSRTMDFNKYYRRIGFEPTDSFWFYKVYTESAPADSSDAQKFRMVIL